MLIKGDKGINTFKWIYKVRGRTLRIAEYPFAHAWVEIIKHSRGSCLIDVTVDHIIFHTWKIEKSNAFVSKRNKK